MCRFLLVRSKYKIKPETLLNQFALMCQKSRAPDGDWQGDGWGIAIGIKNSEFRIQNWREYKSLKPVWEDKDKFQEFAETDMFVVHARSAGFPQHKGNIEFTEPFIQDELCYVFNGMIKGVKIERKLKGIIGAQKIFSLILEEKKGKSLEDVLISVDKLLLENSVKIIGMNIGVVKENKFYMLCEYEENTDYFGLRYFQDQELTIICSQPIGSYKYKVIHKGEILVL